MGIWDRSHANSAVGMLDGTAITALDRSPCERFVVTADYNGCVRLLNYPCVVAEAPALTATGHASFVTCARWSSCGRVMTSGGSDDTMFQWRATLPPPKPQEPSTQQLPAEMARRLVSAAEERGNQPTYRARTSHISEQQVKPVRSTEDALWKQSVLYELEDKIASQRRMLDDGASEISRLTKVLESGNSLPATSAAAAGEPPHGSRQVRDGGPRFKEQRGKRNRIRRRPPPTEP